MFATACTTFGYEVKNTTFSVFITRIPVLYSGIFNLCTLHGYQFHYGRMQLIDINRGPVARAFGLAELKLVTAAAASGVTIPGLADADAEHLRDRLVELAESRRAGL